MRSTQALRFWIVLFPVAASGAAGCSVSDLDTADRREKGLVVVLPGIEGRSFLNVNLARGLDEGGVRSAIEIFDWGTSVPGGMFINLTDYERNQRMAEELKDHLLTYSRQHPGRPVHVVGHSGGGGVAVLAVESLPAETEVTSVVLLAAAISPRHDLRPALRRTKFGIFNYYSPYDQALLGVGTTMAGTIDRHFVPAAGAVGFDTAGNTTPDDATLYKKLHQIEWTPQMKSAMNFGGHMDWTYRPFVRQYLAPLINDFNRSQWEPSVARSDAP